MGLESANPWAAGAAIGGGLLKTGIGIAQNIKSNKLLKNLQYPTQVIPSAIKENKVQAELDANTGLPSEVYNQTMKNIRRNQINSLASGAYGRMGLGLVAALNDNANNATAQLDAADAQARVRNKGILRDVNNTYGNWQNRVWQNNVKDKYDRDYNYAMSLKGAGRQNAASGVDALISGGLSFGANGGFGRYMSRNGNSNGNTTAGYDPAWDNYEKPL